ECTHRGRRDERPAWPGGVSPDGEPDDAAEKHRGDEQHRVTAPLRLADRLAQRLDAVRLDLQAPLPVLRTLYRAFHEGRQAAQRSHEFGQLRTQVADEAAAADAL